MYAIAKKTDYYHPEGGEYPTLLYFNGAEEYNGVNNYVLEQSNAQLFYTPGEAMNHKKYYLTNIIVKVD